MSSRSSESGLIEQLEDLVEDFNQSAERFEERGDHKVAGAIEACARDVQEVIDDE